MEAYALHVTICAARKNEMQSRRKKKGFIGG